MSVIGIDTSNYTTSIAMLDNENGENCSKLLSVKEGELGLRQSDAVFAHIKSLPELSDRLFSHFPETSVTAVGVSTRPRAVEGSYMPCFMVGYSHARMLAAAFHVPLIEVSHQQGHIAAVLWSAERQELLDRPHLAWHLSGGTTELLLVQPDGKNVNCSKIGGTTDISAGQLIDRTGKLLHLPFPSGKALDELSRQSVSADIFHVKCENSQFSFSGIQNKVCQYFDFGHSPADTASFALRCIAGAVYRATEQAKCRYTGLPIVFSGGVASNTMLREVMQPFSPVFAQPCYSTDNAMGVAVLTRRIVEE